MPPAKKKTADGPKYSELIKAALLGLKERNGSSLAAIKKYMASNFPAAKARPTRHRGACRIAYLHPVPGFPRIPPILAPPSSYLPPAPPSLPTGRTLLAAPAKTTTQQAHPPRAPPCAERPGAQERAQVRRLQGHVNQGQGVLQALARGQGALPPTRRTPRPLAARSRSGARGGGCRGANAAPLRPATALLRSVRRAALSRSQLLARGHGFPSQSVLG